MLVVAMNRRTFLSALATLPASAAGAYRPKLAVQTYVWTQDFAARQITLFDGMIQLFSETRAAGFERVELMPAFFTPETRRRTEGLMRQLGFELPIVYSGARLYDDAADESINKVLELAAIVKLLGCGIINVNPDPKPAQASKTDLELQRQAQGVEKLRLALEERGMKLILHHHSPEMKDGAREWFHLLHNTQVGICLDVDWVHQGGQDPRRLLEVAGKRVASLHIRNARKGIWTQSLDEGDYDYSPILARLRHTRFDGYLVVELAWNPKTQKTRTLKDNLERSRIWAEKTFRI